MWFNTGIEMDATKAHIRYLKGRYGIEIHEESGKKKVAAAVRSVGYPFYSKQFSEYIERLQKHNFKWEDKPFDALYAEYPQCKAALRWWCNRWKDEPHRPLQTEIASAAHLKEFMVLNPPTFSISKKCCDLAKKSAGDLARKKYDASIQFIGVRKAEGGGSLHKLQKLHDRRTARVAAFSAVLVEKRGQGAVREMLRNPAQRSLHAIWV